MYKRRIISIILIFCLLAFNLTPCRAADTKGQWIAYSATPLPVLEGAVEKLPYAEGYYLIYDARYLSLADCYCEDSPLEGFGETPDPKSGKQWHLSVCGQSSARNAGLDGTGVRIAIIDSGYRTTHEDLQNINLSCYKSFVAGDETLTDKSGHGTKVLGVLAAEARNGIGITGLAPKAEYMILKAFSDTGGTQSSLVSALGYAIDNGADVINISAGSSVTTQKAVLQPLLTRAYQSGIIVTSAVGNTGKSDILYPSGCSGVIGVGSSTRTGTHHAYSNHNAYVDILAPGVDIYTLTADGDDTYAAVNGTSFATPMVTALAAWAKQVNQSFSADTFLELLKKTATDGGEVGYDTYYGWGTINGKAFVSLLSEQRTMPFRDVAVTAWYYEPVKAMFRCGIMKGVSEDAFAPNATMTRAMAVTILYRHSEEEAPSADSDFMDVADGLWYSDSVRWAANKGIVMGYGDGTFRPDATVTRAQFVAMLHRYYRSLAPEGDGDLTVFTDYNSIPSWAAEDLSWAVSAGILQGMGDGTLAPLASLTRAQTASLLYKLT